MTDETPQESGWRIEGTFYPVPTRLSPTDPVLIRELTGMSFVEFTKLLDEDAAAFEVMLGFLGVAVWQQNRKWTRAEVVAFVNDMDLSSMEVVGDEAEGDAGPPALAEEATAATSSDSPARSNGSQASTSNWTKLATTGTQPSATGSPD